MIPLKVHNVLDYVVGIVLLLCPYVFGFNNVEPAESVFLFGGAALILYSLMTNYYFALTRVIPLGVHMTMDALLGVLLIVAPYIFGYREMITDGQYALHVVLGIGAMGLVALTSPRTEAAKTPAEREAIHHEVHAT